MLNALQKVYVICNFRLFNILNADVLSVFTYRVKLCYCRTGKKSYNVFPFKFIDRLAVYEIEPDETHVSIELLDIQLAFVMLMPYHFYQFLIPGCEHVCRSFFHVASTEFANDSTQLFIPTSHVSVVRNIPELYGSIYIEHRPSSFEMKVSSSG